MLLPKIVIKTSQILRTKYHEIVSAVFCSRLARTQVIHILLRLIERCDHQEGKLQIRICSAILSTLYRMCVYSKYFQYCYSNNV